MKYDDNKRHSLFYSFTHTIQSKKIEVSNFFIQSIFSVNYFTVAGIVQWKLSTIVSKIMLKFELRHSQTTLHPIIIDTYA